MEYSTTFYKGIGNIYTRNDGLLAIVASSCDFDKTNTKSVSNKHLTCGSLNEIDLTSFSQRLPHREHRQTHEGMCFTREELRKQQLVSSLTIFAQPHWYAQHVGAVKSSVHSDEVIFYRAPFQSLMFYHTVFWLIERYGLENDVVSIFLDVKHHFGLSYLSCYECLEMYKRYNKKVTAHIIPRRHGKTAFTKIALGLMIALFPFADLKLVYIAQNAALPKDVLSAVNSIVQSTERTFNQTQLLRQNALRQLGHVQQQHLPPSFKLNLVVNQQHREIICTFSSSKTPNVKYTNSCKFICYSKNRVSHQVFIWSYLK